MAKRLSPAAIVALKEALCSIYWYKSDLRSFIHSCVSDPQVLACLNWDGYKRQVASDLIDQLCSDQAKYLGDLTRLCTQICELKSFPHLERLDGGTEKVKLAAAAVEQLANLVAPHQQAEDEEAVIQARQRKAEAQLRASSAVRVRLDELKRSYLALVTDTDSQARGYAVERLLYDLFELFDLDPKASFKLVGEQIDGAFSLEGTDYLLEARWRNNPSGVDQLDAFGGKVTRKLENTLGVFLAINGYSPEAIQAHSKARPNIVLMDGADLMAVLEERIDFVTLLLRKKRHASQTGNIYLRVHEIV